MTRPHRQISGRTIAAQPANQMTLAAGCIRIPAGAEMHVQIARKNNTIVVYDAHDGNGPQAFVAPNATFGTADRTDDAAPRQCLKQTAQGALRDLVDGVGKDGSTAGNPLTDFILRVPTPTCVAGGGAHGKATTRTHDLMPAPRAGQKVAFGQRIGRRVAVAGSFSAAAGEPAILRHPSYRPP